MNVEDMYRDALEQYEFDIEAYADVAQHIVTLYNDDPMAIGNHMLRLQRVYEESDAE